MALQAAVGCHAHNLPAYLTAWPRNILIMSSHPTLCLRCPVVLVHVRQLPTLKGFICELSNVDVDADAEAKPNPNPHPNLCA